MELVVKEHTGLVGLFMWFQSLVSVRDTRVLSAGLAGELSLGMGECSIQQSFLFSSFHTEGSRES